MKIMCCTKKIVIIAAVIVLVIGGGCWHLLNRTEVSSDNSELVNSKNWRFSGHVLMDGVNQPVKISFYQDGTEFRDCEFQDVDRQETVHMDVVKDGDTFYFEGMKDGMKYTIEVLKNADGSSWMGALHYGSKTMNITLTEEKGI